MVGRGKRAGMTSSEIISQLRLHSDTRGVKALRRVGAWHLNSFGSHNSPQSRTWDDCWAEMTGAGIKPA